MAACKLESGQGLLPGRHLFLLLLMGSECSSTHLFSVGVAGPQATNVKVPLDLCVSELAFLSCCRGGCCNLLLLL